MFFNTNDMDVLNTFNKCMRWIQKYSNNNAGIAVSSKNQLSYPEVTGYFIPTLIKWGERDKALQFAQWLVSVQNENGSWNDPAGKTPYTFDTGQVLKGLMTLVDYIPEFKEPILRGCDWILKQIKSTGQITTPDTRYWKLPNSHVVPEAVQLYALQPIKEAGEKWKIDSYLEIIDRALRYYLAQPGLTNFDTLSHFHAYVIEALIDLGQTAKAEEAMEEINILQRHDGAVPAYSDTEWVCSTGLFQYAVIWYRLGNIERANSAFRYGRRLQNESGGFFGGYGVNVNYFEDAEISWANKYFLDAFWWKIQQSFEEEVSIFPDSISVMDGRYQLLEQIMNKANPQVVLDIGCGKGRFIRRLKENDPTIQAFGMDISSKMLEHVPSGINTAQGTFLNMPFPNEFCDFAFCIEALEHAVDIPNAIREMGRVVKKDGTLIIIDKNKERLGKIQIADWEQWFSENDVTRLLKKEGFSVEITQNIAYDNRNGEDGLFIGWIARKNEK